MVIHAVCMQQIHMSVVFFLGTGDMTQARLGIVRVVAHPAARMFA